MVSMKINFCGPVADVSGYGEFSRYFVYALDQFDVDISVEKIELANSSIGFGEKGKVCQRLTKKKPADINIVNMVPTLFKPYKSAKAKNVGFTMWESSRLPDIWVKTCNEMDAIFVPCFWNQEVFVDSGVSVPVHVVQPGIAPGDIPEINNKEGGDCFTFYSVFQWSERKNPEGLVKTYLSEFRGCGSVELVLKTYRHSRHPNNHQFIAQEVEKIKTSLNIPAAELPKISFITENVSTKEMSELYKKADCYVSAHRAEGWSLPLMEAMTYGIPVIATGFSGNMDFMNRENSYLVGCGMTPCVNMDWYIKWFNGSMWWAEPNLRELAGYMREAYEHRDVAKEIGLAGRQHIIENFNIKNSVRQLMAAAEEVC